MDALIRDLRHAVRGLRRSPGFAAAAVLTLALGIGATTAVFGLLDATLFRPLPFPEPDRLVALHLAYERPGEEPRRTRWSHPEFEALREAADGFRALAAFGAVGFNLTIGDEPVRVEGEVVSASYFRALGVETRLGRTFGPDEGGPPGAHPVTVLSHGLWRERFGGEPGVIGRAVRVNGVPLTVVGVMPEGFRGLTGPADLWVTQAMAPAVTYPEQLTTHQHFLNVVGRLEKGVSLESARSAVGPAMAEALARRFGHAGEAVWGVSLAPLDAVRIDPRVRRERWVLFGAALLVLLIAGADLACLLLARGLVRRREIAIRLALGSGRGRLVRQLLVESSTLAVLGGAAGALLAVWITRALDAFLPAGYTGSGYGRLFQFATLAVDGRVLLFAGGLALAAGLLFGLGPALALTRSLAAPDLGARQPGPGPARGRRSWLDRAFSAAVAGQFALALTLLVGAGLLLASLSNLTAREGGFDPEGVIAFRVSPSSVRYGPEDGPALLEALLERVQTVPGVASASVAPCLPFTSCPTRLVRLPPEEDPGDEWLTVRRHYVAPGHFRALGIPLLRGRGLAAEDRPGRPNVVLVNRSLARHLWPDRDPVGRELVFQGADLNFVGPDSTATVVGVVEDVPYGDAAAPIGHDVYTSFRQFAWPSTHVVVRTDRATPAGLVPALRRAVARVDPHLPVYDVAGLEERREAALAGHRFNGALLAAFAGLALLLAAVGIYGVMSQYVGRRTREMGIRRAVGADRRDVLGLVIRRGLLLALAGVATGSAGGLAAGRALASQLYGVSPTEPGVLLGAALFLLAVGFLAVLLPALRAARLDPAAVLRAE